MILNRIKENWLEFTIALIALILASAYSLVVLYRLYPHLFSTGSINSAQIADKQNRFIINNSQNKCFGNLVTNVKSDNQNIELTANSSLNIKLSDKSDLLHTKIESAFNPLNQMVASVFNFKTNENELIIGLLNVDPVELSVNLNKNKQNVFKRKFAIEGPFMLKNIGGSLSIEHQPTGKSIPLDLSSIIASVLNLNFVVTNNSSEQATENSTCPPDSSSELNLDLLSQQLQSKLQALLPDLGPEALAISKLIESAGAN